MPLTLLTGLAGSGKSRRLIETVNAARSQGREVLTFVCSEFPWPTYHGAFLVHRRLVCRQPELPDGPDGDSRRLTCNIDHFVSRGEAAAILAKAEPGALAAVDEGYAFGPAAVKDWAAAADRGVEVLVAAPSDHQVGALKGVEHMTVNLALPCRRCGRSNASNVTIDAGGDTLTVCSPCYTELHREAWNTIVSCLRDEHPSPGEEFLYQPVPLPQLSEWKLARWDSLRRAQAMEHVLTELGISPAPSGDPLTYLDVGCNTGLFCDYIAARGYRVKGVDATKRFITVARLLDSFFRRKLRPGGEGVVYEQANAYEYLEATQQERFDVTSAFAVFQWVMIQRTPRHGLDCIEWLAAKTRRVCFLEMGYSREEMYQGQLEVEIDREWVLSTMQERGGFDDIRVINASPDGLQRDLFVGIKNTGEALP